MKLSKARKRTAKKLVLPLVAIAMMATMMSMESASRRSRMAGSSTSPAAASAHTPAPTAAARLAPDLRHR